MAILSVPITKGKASIDIETDDIPQDVYAEALLQGLKVLLNRGASKITKETYPNPDELVTAALAKASEQVELVKTSKIKFTGGKSKSKASGAVMTEARRLAKNIVKDEMKRAGLKISHYEAKEITAAANALLESDPSIIETAAANLEARLATPTKLDIKSLVKASPALVAKAEEKKAKDKANRPLSAKQAGKVAPRAKAKPSANVMA